MLITLKHFKGREIMAADVLNRHCIKMGEAWVIDSQEKADAVFAEINYIHSPESNIDAAIRKGLGDEVESLLKKLGADRAARWYEQVTGRSCGCDERKKWLNEKFPEGIKGLFK